MLQQINIKICQIKLKEYLYDAAYAVVGHYKGGLAMSTVGACAGFGMICGSSIATAATMSYKSFTFLSKKISSKKFINLLGSIYEHSPWVPERLLSKQGIGIKTKREFMSLYFMLVII